MKNEVKVSVIIPVYNDPEGIITTLKSFLNQTFDKKYEIIIIDNNSSDDTFSKAKSYTTQNHKNNNLFEIKLLKQTKLQSSYATRNKGIKHSQGELLCFIDSNMWVEKEYLSKVYQTYLESKKKYFYMGCKVGLIMEKRNLIEKTNVLTGFPIKKYVKEKHFVPTCCLTVNRILFNNIGFFNETLISGGDWEFGQRVHKRNIRQIYKDNIIVYHFARKTFSSLAKKHIRIGKGLQQLEKKGQYNFLSTALIKLIPSIPSKSNKKICLKIHEKLLVYFIIYFGIRLPTLFGYILEYIDNE